MSIAAPPSHLVAYDHRVDDVFADGSPLVVEHDPDRVIRGDLGSPAWVVDWGLALHVQRAVVHGDSVWLLVQSALGHTTHLAGVTLASGPLGDEVAALRVDGATGALRAARLLAGAHDTDLAVDDDDLYVADGSHEGRLWRLAADSLEITATIDEHDIAASTLTASQGAVCYERTDSTTRDRVRVCRDHSLREFSSDPLPGSIRALWTTGRQLTARALGDSSELDLDIEANDTPPLRVSAVCRAAEQRGILDTLSMWDKEGTQPPVDEGCRSTRVLATGATTTADGTRWLAVWASSSIRVGGVEVPIRDGRSTTVVVTMQPTGTARVTAFPDCDGGEFLSSTWLRLGCKEETKVVRVDAAAW